METLALPQAPYVRPPTYPQTDSDSLIDMLIEHGTDTVFGYTGASVMPLFDALYRRRHQAMVEIMAGEMDANPLL